MKNRIGEPPVQRRVAPIAGRRRILLAATRAACWAPNAYVHMIIVPEEGAHFVEPTPISCWMLVL